MQFAIFHGENGSTYSVGVRSVGQGGVEFYLVGGGGEVDEHCAGVAAAHFDHFVAVVGEDLFGLTGHSCAEVVGGHDLRVLEFVVAASADAVIAPVVLAGGAGGTAVE